MLPDAVVDVSIAVVPSTGLVEITLTLTDEDRAFDQVETRGNHVQDKLAEPTSIETPRMTPRTHEATKGATEYLMAVLDIRSPNHGSSPPSLSRTPAISVTPLGMTKVTPVDDFKVDLAMPFGEVRSPIRTKVVPVETPDALRTTPLALTDNADHVAAHVKGSGCSSAEADFRSASTLPNAVVEVSIAVVPSTSLVDITLTLTDEDSLGPLGDHAQDKPAEPPSVEIQEIPPRTHVTAKVATEYLMAVLGVGGPDDGAPPPSLSRTPATSVTPLGMTKVTPVDDFKVDLAMPLGEVRSPIRTKGVPVETPDALETTETVADEDWEDPRYCRAEIELVNSKKVLSIDPRDQPRSDALDEVAAHKVVVNAAKESSRTAHKPGSGQVGPRSYNRAPGGRDGTHQKLPCPQKTTPRLVKLLCCVASLATAMFVVSAGTESMQPTFRASYTCLETVHELPSNASTPPPADAAGRALSSCTSSSSPPPPPSPGLLVSPAVRPGGDSFEAAAPAADGLIGASPHVASAAILADQTLSRPPLPALGVLLTSSAWTLLHSGGGQRGASVSLPRLCTRMVVTLLLGMARSVASGCDNTCDQGNPAWASDGTCDDGGPGANYASCALGTDCTDCGPRVFPPPPPPPGGTSSVGDLSDVDARFGCGCSACSNVVSVTTASQLEYYVADTSKTCIKLAAGVVFYDTGNGAGGWWLQVDHKVALVAEGGTATIDGRRSRQVLKLMSSAADVSLLNLVLINGIAQVSVSPPSPWSPTACGVPR